MLRRTFLLSLAALFLPLTACQSTSDGPRADASSPRVAGTPQSSLVALVRALEVLDAVRDPQAHVRVRAIECDTMFDRREGGEYVRVMLDLTVLAPSFDRAYGVFDALRSALDHEATATRRVDTLSEHRLRRVFVDMDWSARQIAGDEEFERLVSLSDTVRLEVRRGASRSLELSLQEERSAEEAEDRGTQDAEKYIREAAGAPVGPVEISRRRAKPAGAFADLRYRIRPASEDVGLSRSGIGRFLHSLEAGSPAVRITRLEIEPSGPGEDVTGDRWTFEADMSLRVTRPDAG